MTSARATLLRASVLVAVVTACTGCPAVDVVVAEDQADAETEAGEAGPLEGGTQTCAQSSDCSPAEYCARAKCSSTEGVCELRPFSCDDTEQLVCGCDGVLYWNDCLRQRDGVGSSTTGLCATHIATCGGPKDGPCPVQDAVCGRVDVGGMGMGCTGPGICWVLPDSCPDAGANEPRWATCGPPPAACDELCDALRSEKPFTRPLQHQCP